MSRLELEKRKDVQLTHGLFSLYRQDTRSSAGRVTDGSSLRWPRPVAGSSNWPTSHSLFVFTNEALDRVLCPDT